MSGRWICASIGAALWLGLPFAAAAERSSGAAVSPKQPGSEGVAAEPAVPAAVAAPPPSSSTPAAAAKKQGAKGQPGDAKKGLLPGGGDKPLSIRSDELEALQEEGGARHMVFQRNVRAEQGDMVVNANRLEAHYPPEANQPDRLFASGQVRIVSKDRNLTCDNATYYKAEDHLVCVGNAVMWQGDDRVHGDTIEIFNTQKRVLVHGSAQVNVKPQPKDEAKPEPKKAEATP